MYSNDFFDVTFPERNQAATVIVPKLVEWLQPKSVIDVGCGDGIWLTHFELNGVRERTGVDGDWVKPESLRIDARNFITHDLTKPFSRPERYGLALSLEVAEHLPEASAQTFIDTLTSLSSVVVFSAAIPGQGGVGHINEQWMEYWVERFAMRGFTCIDKLRWDLWNAQVAPYYKSNILCFSDLPFREHHPFRGSAVHPGLWEYKLGALCSHS